MNNIQFKDNEHFVLPNGTSVYDLHQSINVKVNLLENTHSTLVLIHTAKDSIDFSFDFQLEKQCNLTLAFVSLINQSYHGTINIEINGEYSSVNVQSGILGNQIKDLKMNIYHLSHNGISNMEHYGLMTSNYPFTIEAGGYVTKGCKGNDCRQALRAATFSDNKAITLKPMLYIDDFDCQAAHACTIGQISPRQMYYLQSKGLSRQSVMALIAKGYMQPVVDCIEDNEVKEYLKEIIEKEGGYHVE